MNLIRFLILLLAFMQLSSKISAEITEKHINEEAKTKEPILTAALYAKLFKERRKEHVFMVKQMLKLSYEKNFKLLKLAYAKIFEVLDTSNITLRNQDYQYAKNGFPQEDAGLQESVILILENCCVAAENILHFPEISYRIFGQKNWKAANWKATLNWCIGFIHSLPHVIDEPTFKMMELLQQEINEELRASDYVNPYYKKEADQQPQASQKHKKSHKKLKKGPRLTGGRNEL